MQVVRSDDRGRASLGWLDSRHTFSFGDYYDRQRMGFGDLRVINEDKVQPGAGFGTHGHRDMEIISYVIEGALEHKDSMANGSIIRPGDVQRMTAGTGVLHSEFNPSSDSPVHFLQIWILPEEKSLQPGYEQRNFPLEQKKNGWRLVGSRQGRDGSLTIHQDVDLYATVLDAGATVRHRFAPGRRGWLQVVRGGVAVNGESLRAGDGLALEGVEELDATAPDEAELLLFDLR